MKLDCKRHRPAQIPLLWNCFRTQANVLGHKYGGLSLRHYTCISSFKPLSFTARTSSQPRTASSVLALAGLGSHLNQLANSLARAEDGRREAGAHPADPRFHQPLSGLYGQIAEEPNGAENGALALTPAVAACQLSVSPNEIARDRNGFRQQRPPS